jgi:hypothetical protein
MGYLRCENRAADCFGGVASEHLPDYGSIGSRQRSPQAAGPFD